MATQEDIPNPRPIEANRPPLSVVDFDSRKDLPDGFPDVESLPLTRVEAILIYQIHLFLSGKISTVPEKDMPSLGERLKRDLENFDDPIYTAADEGDANEIFIAMINSQMREQTGGDSLDEEISELHLSGRSDEITPLILDRFTLAKSDTAPVLLVATAARRGLFIYLQRALKAHINLRHSTT